MPMVASRVPYTLLVCDDDQPLNPREDYDNFGTMVCWHRRYSLGDEHKYDDPSEFLHDKLFSIYSSYPSSEYGKPVYDFLKSGKAETAKLEYNRSTREWELSEQWFGGKEWNKSSSYPASLKGKDVPDWFLDDCLSALKNSEMMKLLEQSGQFVIMPLYLYDHSGITISTGPFSCPWDSGQVGWIYADADKIKEEYGEVTPETLKKTANVLESEVKDYDYYLTGQCYGFQLFEGDTEVDSCWGFLGDIRDMQDDLKGYLPDSYEDLAEKLEYDYGEFDIDDYIEEETEETEELDDEL